MPETGVLLVTGAGRGIGRRIAEHYLERGWVVAGCGRSPTDLAHARYAHFVLDVADEARVVDMVRTLADTYGRLDAVVNNAGVAAMNHFALTPAATMRRLLSTNVLGPLLVTREAVKLMMRRRYGRIVMLGSVAVPLSVEGEAVYAASKAALAQFARVLAKEVGPFNITCNVVAPSPVQTDMIRGVPEDSLRRIIDRLAIKRFCQMDDVLHCVDFFLDERSGYITGQVMYLGGVA